MPPAGNGDGRNRKIRDFFKPFTIPKSRIPVNNVIEDEIVVAPAKASSPRTQDRVPKLPHSPKRGGEDLRSSQRSDSSLLSTLPGTATQDSTSKTPPEERTGVPQIDGSADNAARSSSPLHSPQRRVMAAVEMPSTDGKQPKVDARETINTTKTSFSSVSTLSSVPMSTQSSSKRVVRNGMQAVTNSDSGSADSSSSEDDLPDMSTFVPRKKPKLATPGEDAEQTIDTPSTVKLAARQSARLSASRKKSSRAGTPPRETTPPGKVYKHSLLNMAKQKAIEERVQAKMRELEADFEQDERMQEEVVAVDGASRGRKAALADESDEGERMMLAMQRIEAGAGEEAFFYFQGVRNDIQDHAFPLPHIQGDVRAWVKELSNEQWRAQACLTGFLRECVAKDGLPEPQREWFTTQLILEKREDLCEAYVDILAAGAESGHEEVKAFSFGVFYRTHDGSPVQKAALKTVPLHAWKVDSQTLSDIARIISSTNAQCGNADIAHHIFELMFANIDMHVRGTASSKCVIEDSIEYLLDSAEEENEIFTHVATSLAESKASTQLKCRAIACLPARTQRSHSLRRRLAFELVDNRSLSPTSKSPQHGESIVERLRSSPEFHISDSTDYVLLNSLVCILDIAIDAGFYDLDFHSPNAPPISPSKKGKVSLLEKSQEAERAFNAQIDILVSALTLMSSRIKDAGTTHLRRTEAKHAIERLTKRLEYGVRTKPRPRQKTFGGMTGDVQRGFLHGFLKKVDVPDMSVKNVDESATRAVMENPRGMGGVSAVESIEEIMASAYDDE